MKGTLFSADFVKDNNGNLRLLELNTDTAIIPEEVINVDWSDLISVLQSNNITTFDIIYKPIIHQVFVNNLSSSLSSAGIETINLHSEDVNTIYPTSIEDSSDKFILRLAYDESAIFDSTYCKNRFETFKLFMDGDSDTYVSPFYYSSSEYEYNNIDETILNDINIPDVCIKDLEASSNPISFYKIGTEVDGETINDRWSSFIGNNKSDNTIIEQYMFHSSSLNDENKITSIRSFNIVYGSELEILSLHSYKVPAIFSIPDISQEINESSYSIKIQPFHYYEYTTNMIKPDSSGILSSHKILMSDETHKSIIDIEVGDSIKSFFISGSPQVESDYDTLNWSSNGNSFPSGSYVTSSEVVYKDVDQLKYGGMIEYVVDGDSLFSGISKQYLVYDSSSNETKFKHAVEVNPDIDYFYDIDGSLIDLDVVNFYVTTDTELSMVQIDVEDTDTYIISGSTQFNAVVSHNAPCFVAGTQISLASGGVKNIEEIKVGDLVLTYNHDSNEIEHKEVEQIIHKNVDSTVKYTFDNGDVLECTLDHPLYSVDGYYVSYKPEQSKLQYGLQVGQVEIGTKILLQDGTSLKITSIDEKHGKVTVYNLHDVKDNHNFFANKMLVHNRCFVAGTEITLSNGDFKNIEDVVVGEEVLTYNEESGVNEKGIVGNLKQHEVNSVIRLTLDNQNIIITTQEHPFFVEGKGWVKAGELQPLDVCKKVDGSESLISTVEVLEETHIVYNLLSVSENHNFYANGILVHNK